MDTDSAWAYRGLVPHVGSVQIVQYSTVVLTLTLIKVIQMFSTYIHSPIYYIVPFQYFLHEAPGV